MNCILCNRPLGAEPRVSWFAKDSAGNTYDRGAVHLTCLQPSLDDA